MPSSLDILTGPPRKVELDYRPRRWARPFHAFQGRWSALVLHRRAGKTTGVMNHHQRAATNDAWEAKRLRFLSPDVTDQQIKELLRARMYGHVLPTYKQAKLVAWEMLKHFADPIPGRVFNEAELYVRYPNKARLQLFGADSPDSLRGPAFSGLSFDEYAQHPPNIFSEVLSKSLADHLGYAVFCGTIKGKNQLYQTWRAGQNDPAWFTVWQDIDRSLLEEDDAATLMLQQAMHDDRALVAKGLMTQEEFEQEWYLSTTAAVKGAYYAKQLAQAWKEQRITRVPHDPALPVDTDWDLGVDDATAIWFSQSLRSREVRLIDYYEATGEGLAHYVRVLRERAAEHGYTYGEHWAPHDIQVRELGTGKSRLETAASLGIRFKVARMLDVIDGIDAARLLLPRCWFDEQKCAHGIEALTQYKPVWNERLQVAGQPEHGWPSHGSDAYRYLAVRHQVPEDKKVEKVRQPFTSSPHAGTGWMA